MQADLKPRVLNATDAHEYRTYGGEHWDQFDGGFFDCHRVDMHSDQLLIVNDRLGVLPPLLCPADYCLHLKHGVLVNAEFTPKLSNEGVGEFSERGILLRRLDFI